MAGRSTGNPMRGRFEPGGAVLGPTAFLIALLIIAAIRADFSFLSGGRIAGGCRSPAGSGSDALLHRPQSSACRRQAQPAAMVAAEDQRP